MIDFLIVIFYFLLIFFIALRGKVKSNGTAEEYFLSNFGIQLRCQQLQLTFKGINF